MVTTIYQYGEDALNNEINIKLSLPVFLLDDLGGEISFRAMGITIPDYAPRTFTQNFRGYEIERWKPGTETSRDVTVTFRMDKYWRVYDALLTWAKQIVNLEDGSYYPDTTGVFSGITEEAILYRGASNVLRGILSVSQENSMGQPVGKGWTFEGIWPKSIESIPFDASSSGEPISVNVVFSYIKCKRGE